ncbi:MAG: hypothetical protein KGK07_09625 [Chloroflexota bacterium]|nr:hypothetical protein [Chloroflexota bacterium]
MGPRGLALLGVLAGGLLLAACDGGSAPARPTAIVPTPTTTPARATSPVLATLDGGTLRVVRTLQPDALTADKLTPAGVAVAPDGTNIAMSRGAAPALAAWELASQSAGGWRVWWPEPAVRALAEAGRDARVVAVTALDWPDTCLGVRMPGRACAQVVTPGYRIIVEAGGKRIEYHTDRASPPHVVISAP